MIFLTLFIINIVLYLWLESILFDRDPNSFLNLCSDVINTRIIKYTDAHCKYIVRFVTFMIFNLLAAPLVTLLFGVVYVQTLTSVKEWLKSNIRNLIDVYNDKIGRE